MRILGDISDIFHRKLVCKCTNKMSITNRILVIYKGEEQIKSEN